MKYMKIGGRGGVTKGGHEAHKEMYGRDAMKFAQGGELPNEGLKALAKEAPEAVENMGFDVADYGKKLAEAGSKMPKEVIDYFESKEGKEMAMEGMKILKAYGGKMNYGGKMAKEGTATDPVPGPFAAAQSQIEQNFSPIIGNLLSQIESDPKKMAWAQENIPGGLENANVYQLSQAADPNHEKTQINRLARMARQAGLPIPVETVNLYDRMNSGRFDVATMDAAMIDRGYVGEAGDVFARGVVEGKINLGALVSANTRDLGTVDKTGKFNFKVFDVPTGYEFLETNKRSIRRDGSIKGDNRDDLTWYAQLGRGTMKTVGPDPEDPTPPTPPEVPVTTMPDDPMATINPLDPRQLPNPRSERTIQGEITPFKVLRNEPTTEPGPSFIDYGIRPEPQISTYNVSQGGLYQVPDPSVIQPGGGSFINPEEKTRAMELAEMLKGMRDKGGRAKKRKPRVYRFGGMNY